MELNDEQKLTVIGLAVAVAIGSAVYFYNHCLVPAKPSVLLDEPAKVFKPKNAEVLTVHVCGAVLREGVYELFPGDRVITALKLAGGAGANADLSSVNLAEDLKDGQKIIIPQRAVKSEAASSSGGLVSLNRATEAELDNLPGIGPSTAKKIVEARPYAKIEDLLKIPRFGKSRLDNIRNRVTI